VCPIDILPDIFGPAGRLDDLLIAAYLAFQALKRLPSANQQHTTSSSTSTPPGKSQPASDPYAVFDLPRSSTAEEINERYRELMKQYHPDRVASLGKELRELAHEKTIEIQKAYDQLIQKNTSSESR
jgi:DnaJ like chaperone protein